MISIVCSMNSPQNILTCIEQDQDDNDIPIPASICTSPTEFLRNLDCCSLM